MKSELSSKYELMLIVDSKLATDSKEAILKQTIDVVSKAGGKVINSSIWLDKHRLTFLINKCNEGMYYLLNIEMERSAVDKINSQLRLNEKILRFMLIAVDSWQMAEAVKS